MLTAYIMYQEMDSDAHYDAANKTAVSSLDTCTLCSARFSCSPVNSIYLKFKVHSKIMISLIPAYLLQISIILDKSRAV